MIISRAVRHIAISMGVLFIVAEPFDASPARAQDRHAMREREHERTRFQTQHWAWDHRFNHNHYYPAVGYTVRVLPAGHTPIVYRSGRYFFHSGVWFQFTGGRYLVVRPPLGVILPALPVGYTQVWAGGTPYYYANDVYYAATPRGYVVTAPPPDLTWQEQGPQPTAPIPASPPQVAAGAGNPAQPAPGTWYYCDSSRAYYPNVPTCNEPWRPVPAAPPPPPQQ